MSSKKNLVLAGALSVFAVMSQQAVAGVNDPGQIFIDRLSGASVASTVGGVALSRTSRASSSVRPSDYYGLFNGDTATPGLFEQTQGLGMGERAGATRR